MTTSFLISTPSRWGLTELSHSWILYRVTAALVLRNGSATAVAPDFQGDTAPLCSLALRPHYLQHSTHSCHYFFYEQYSSCIKESVFFIYCDTCRCSDTPLLANCPMTPRALSLIKNPGTSRYSDTNYTNTCLLDE